MEKIDDKEGVKGATVWREDMIVLSSDEESTNDSQIEKIATRVAKPVSPQAVAEFQKKMAKLETQFESACRLAHAAESSVDILGYSLEFPDCGGSRPSKRDQVAVLQKKLAEAAAREDQLQKAANALSGKLSAAIRRVDRFCYSGRKRINELQLQLAEDEAQQHQLHALRAEMQRADAGRTRYHARMHEMVLKLAQYEAKQQLQEEQEMDLAAQMEEVKYEIDDEIQWLDKSEW